MAASVSDAQLKTEIDMFFSPCICGGVLKWAPCSRMTGPFVNCLKEVQGDLVKKKKIEKLEFYFMKKIEVLQSSVIQNTQDEQDENVSFRLLTPNCRQTTAAKLPVPKGLAAFVNCFECKLIIRREQLSLA